MLISLNDMSGIGECKGVNTKEGADFAIGNMRKVNMA